MSNFDFIPQRKRQQHLFIVEGKHEKKELLGLMLQCFPEMNIQDENIVIYESNIFNLNARLEKEYGEDWEDTDVDLPYVVSKMQSLGTTWYKDNFIDIFLIFDYERQDTYFSDEIILKMQKYFSNETDMGKLYINYPMVESYWDTFDAPQQQFSEKKVMLPLKNGNQYKLRTAESLIAQAVELPQRIDNILEKECKVEDSKVRKRCVEEILVLRESHTLMECVQNILTEKAAEHSFETKTRLICDKIKRIGYTEQNTTYLAYMRNEFCKIICRSIRKASLIQNGDYNISDAQLKQSLVDMDAVKILKEQNRCSKDEQNGFVWVLNTSVLLVPDYSYDLITKHS